jgi:hypothetical protein
MALIARGSSLPVVREDVRLPKNYQVAKAALAACERIDEAAIWADRAEALRAYAVQSHDKTLEAMVRRLRARAMRKCGELLQQIPEQRGRRTDRLLGRPDGTRTRAAMDAGLSKSQHQIAIRLANIPTAAFEAAVESANPPGCVALVKRFGQRKPAATKEVEAAVKPLLGRRLRLAHETSGGHPPEVHDEGVFERAERLLAELLSVYAVAPALLRARIRNTVIRKFADVADGGEDRLEVRDRAL